MSGVKRISELGRLTSLVGDAEIPVALNGQTYKIKLSDIKKLAETTTGGTGNQEVTKEYLNLGNVDNTSDANKPVSIAQALALATKADRIHSHGVSDITGLQAILSGYDNSISLLISDLSKKANVSHKHDISDINNLATELLDRPTEATVTNMINASAVNAAKNSVTLTKTEW